MKKFLAFLVTVAMLVSVGVLAACATTPSYVVDTYKGSASKDTYESEDEAIEAYLEIELSGESSTAVYVNHKVEKELTQSEISALGLSADESKNLQKVQQIRVEYKEESKLETVALLAAAEAKTQYRTVLVLVYSDGSFRYYATKVQVGETLTASYLESVFDSEKYVNCTMETSMNLEVKGSGVNMTMSMTGNSKVTKDAFYAKQTIPGYGTDEGSSTMEIYAWNVEGGYYGAMKSGNEWQASPLQSGSISMLIDNSLGQSFGGFDSTYFKKTADGYELKSELGKEWLIDYYKQMSGQDVDDVFDQLSSFNIEYKVSIRDGRISQLSISCIFSATQNGTAMSMKISGVNKITNVGSTTVTVPKEILDLVK